MTPPDSLRDGEVGPVWEAVRLRLERSGVANRGRVSLPALSTRGRLVLTSLLDQPLRATLDLAHLERSLVRVGAGANLIEALSALGHPVSFATEHRRAERRERQLAREHFRSLVDQWPEDWAALWSTDAIQAGLLVGLDAAGAVTAARDVRRCLDAAAVSGSRVELAARILGDSHALDPGTRLHALLRRALRHQYADDLADDSDRSVWDRAGAPADSVSAPALTWRLPLALGCALRPFVEPAEDAGVVVHLSQMLLRAHPPVVERSARVLVVENPRIVEAAAQRRCPTSLIATNGNPSAAVVLLLGQLVDSGAELGYHGDFDAAGLGICRRMQALGLTPWRMDTEDYLAAIADASSQGVDLPRDEADPGETPWCPDLADVFRRERRIVHEERLVEFLLG